MLFAAAFTMAPGHQQVDTVQREGAARGGRAVDVAQERAARGMRPADGSKGGYSASWVKGSGQ